MIRIEEAATAEQLDAVRSLFRTFVAWHHATPVEDRRLIARYFDQAAFEAELRDLPGAYAGPKGGLLLGWIGKGPANLTPANLTPAGCVALRDLGDGVCEMKRMFPAPSSTPGPWLATGRSEHRHGARRRLSCDAPRHQQTANPRNQAVRTHRFHPRLVA